MKAICIMNALNPVISSSMHSKVSAGCKPILHSVAPSTIRGASGPSSM